MRRHHNKLLPGGHRRERGREWPELASSHSLSHRQQVSPSGAVGQPRGAAAAAKLTAVARRSGRRCLSPRRETVRAGRLPFAPCRPPPPSGKLARRRRGEDGLAEWPVSTFAALSLASGLQIRLGRWSVQARLQLMARLRGRMLGGAGAAVTASIAVGLNGLQRSPHQRNKAQLDETRSPMAAARRAPG